MIQQFFKLFKSTSIYNTLLLLLLFVVIPMRSGFIAKFTVESSLLVIALLCLGIVFTKSDHYIKLYKIDVLIAVFVLYNSLHFLLLSKNSIFFMELWQRIAVVVVLFLWRWFSVKNSDFKYLLIALILLHFIVEIGLGSLQFFDLLTPVNKNYEVTGSFTAPSFFGVYLSIGITICVWFALCNYVQLNKKQLLLIGSIVLVALFFMGLSGSRTSWLGMLIAITVLIVSLPNTVHFIKSLSKTIKGVLLTSTLLVCLFAIIYSYNLQKGSANGRLFTAKITAQEILKKPMLGHGLFSFSEGYNEAKVNYFSESERTWKEIKNADYLYGALNDYLELTYELGLLGILMLGYMLCLIFPRNRKDKQAVLGLSLLVILLVFMLFSTLLSNQSMLVAGTVIVFLCFEYANKKELFQVKSTYLKIGFCFISICLLGYSCSRIATGVIFKKADKQTLSQKELKLYTKILSYDGSSDFYYGQTVYKKQNKKVGLKLMEQAILKNNHPKKIRKLALYYNNEGNYKRAEELFMFNIQNEPYRYQARMDLAKLYKKTNQIEKLKPLLQEIIDFPVKIPSTKVEEYKRWARELGQIINTTHN